VSVDHLKLMIIYPAIDIKGGRCVRLTQGRADQETIYSENPADIAEQFLTAGSTWVHVVDLDGAFDGEPRNLDRISDIVLKGMKVQLGGGMRTRVSVERALAMGVARVVIGTRAAESDSFVGELVQAFGDRIAVGIDARNGKVTVRGWVSTTDTGALSLAKKMDSLGVSTLIHTDVGTDGMLVGPNLTAQQAMCEAVKANVIASGGVSCRNDVESLQILSSKFPRLSGVIVGKALYEHRVDLRDLLSLASR
jgi:phosphoribosylformimino-5-aminoimidazole carboxamide ribotide isomerase